MADPSFAMQPASNGIVDEILKASGVPEGVPLIGVSLRPWRDQVRWLPEITRGLDAAAAQIGGALVFLPMQREQDFGVSVQVASRMSAPAVVVASRMSPPQTLAACGKMSLMVGMRLHALIFSASTAVPFVSISYDPKIDAFVDAMDQDEPLKLDWLTSADISSRVISAWERRDELVTKACDRMRLMRALALHNAELACELLSD
jgi:polysaccharide pyruvyl transferase WcaK-like protein